MWLFWESHFEHKKSIEMNPSSSSSWEQIRWPLVNASVIFLYAQFQSRWVRVLLMCCGMKVYPCKLSVCLLWRIWNTLIVSVNSVTKKLKYNISRVIHNCWFRNLRNIKVGYVIYVQTCVFSRTVNSHVTGSMIGTIQSSEAVLFLCLDPPPCNNMQ